jgi:hypothetical protein
MEAPSRRQRAVAIVMGIAIIAWIIYINYRLVGEVKQGVQPQPSPVGALPAITPAQ